LDNCPILVWCSRSPLTDHQVRPERRITFYARTLAIS
jgi:hypothetical protein